MTNAAHFEALNYALRKSKDGVIVSFLVQPDDVTGDLLSLPVGARVMVAWSAISDTEQPVASVSPSTRDSSERSPPQELPQAPKPKRERTLGEYCALACREPRFMMFLRDVWHAIPEASAEEAVKAVKRFCRINSRAELDTNQEAAARWRSLYQQYRDWQAQQDYADSVRP